MVSSVHENGDEHEENPTPYAHTHVFIWTKKRMETESPRYFDFQETHPNVQNQRSFKWAKNIVMNYHKGHKTKKDGKKYDIEPVMLWQDGRRLQRKSGNFGVCVTACLQLTCLVRGHHQFVVFE